MNIFFDQYFVQQFILKLTKIIKKLLQMIDLIRCSNESLIQSKHIILNK